jgi:peptidyl-prolyl cis-trans isomerase D
LLVLDLMRRQARSWLIKVALGGIIIVFIFWYGWSGPGERKADYAAKVGETVIGYNEFYAAYESRLEMMRQQFKGQVPEEIQKLLTKQKVLDGLIDQVLLLKEAQRLGLSVTEEDVIRDIQGSRWFQVNGVFDERAYREFLRQIKLNPGTYEEFLKRQLLEGQLLRLLTDSVKADPEEVKRLWHFQNDKLILSVLTIPAEPDKAPPDPAALEAFFKKNQAKYELPPSLNIQYTVFSWKDTAKRLTVPDEDVKTYYDTHPKEFMVPERFQARHILIKILPEATKEQIDDVKKKIEDLYGRIKGGEDFEQAAKSESQDEATASKGGDLGPFSRGTLDPDLEKSIADLKPGEVSAPIRSAQGYHLVRLDTHVPEKQLDLEVVKEKISKKILEDRARKQVERESEQFFEQVYRTDNIEEQAKKFGFEVRKVDGIARVTGIPDVGDDPNVIDEVFRLDAGDISKLMRTGDQFVVAKVLGKNKERIPAFDEVKSRVEKEFLKEQAVTAARKKAESIIEALKNQPDKADEIAQEYHVTWSQLEPVSRTVGFVPKLGSSPDVSEMLSSVSRANPLYLNPISVPGGMSVVRLVRVDAASEEKFQDEAQMLERWMLQVRQTELRKGLVKKLRDREKIDVNVRML